LTEGKAAWGPTLPSSTGARLAAVTAAMRPSAAAAPTGLAACCMRVWPVNSSTVAMP
jgi:hypothetical protein